MSARVAWKANPRQEFALSCPAFELMFGGSRGGGKTDFLIAAVIYQIMLCDRKFRATGRKQRGRALLFRRNLHNLSDMITRTKEIYPLVDPQAKFGEMTRRWTFASGYVIDLAHLDGPDDHRGYHGQEITFLGFDEAPEYVSEEVYDFMVMQVRSPDPDMRELLAVRLTGNPGGRYAEWVKRRFVIGCKPHNQIHRETVKLKSGKTREITRAFIPSTLWDNPYLSDDGTYEANLLKLPDHMRRMYLEGDWDVVVGSRFAHLWRRDLHLIKSFPIPGSQPIKMGIDWGSSAPACCHWATKDRDGNIYFIDELYRPGITGRTFGEAMLKKFQTQKWSADRKYTVDEVYAVIDRQARASMGGDGRWSNAAAGISSWGFRLFDANKDRAARVEQWSERLMCGANGKPKVYIFEDRCPQLAQVIPVIPSDPKNPDDCDQDFENDHPYDSSGFLLMDWPVDTVGKQTPQGDQDVARWLRMAEQRRQKADPDDISTGYDG